MTQPAGTGIARRLHALAGAGRNARPAPAGWVFTFGMLAVMLYTASLRSGQFTPPGPVLLTATVAAWLPLLVRTYLPMAALAGTVLAESAHLLLVPLADARFEVSIGAFQPVPLATMAAAFTLAARVPRRLGWRAGITAGLILMAVGVLRYPADRLLTDLVMFNLVLLATAAGAMVTARRERAEQAAAERENDKTQAVLDERLRIARELHDVLAHNLTLVNAQAGVAEYLMRTDPAAAEQALRNITKHTGWAIDELRATVGLLRYGDEADRSEDSLRPVPGLDRLDALLDSFRSAGSQVGLVETGTARPLGQQGEFAAFRIVQEALTNAAKHAPGTAVTLHFDWSEHRLDLRVTNPVVPSGHERAAGTGHGLIGMRERALAAGGTLTAETLPGNWFEVHATLPATEKGADR
ncbi:sensor histidine kinase [Glycomyces dulcitolivorans]|uniref:sensor histidine kinase n=1 Tax=Glycomyces dulcitolivorans TaxID=2200759 RepID=UPI000DD2FC5F|nr:sensor histidine kinase [Glycomyces dulcitolivorans]